MIDQISWNDYFSFVGSALVAYYLIVVVCFFRVEITGLLTGKFFQKSHSNIVSESDSISNLSIQVVSNIDDILKKHGTNANKDVLLTELRTALNEYGGMKIPAYRNAILDYTVREVRQVCGVEISVIELGK